jgi:S1-C subfamily serine protease
MEAIQIKCDGCGAKLKAPASLPAGKMVKCPGCGQSMKVPERDAKPAVATAPAPKPAAVVVAPPRPAAVAVVEAVTMKPCPFCGENIRPEAVKCKHCNEFLDGDRSVAKKPVKKKSKNASLNPAESLFGLVLAPVGIVVGAVWAASGMRKGFEMLKLSVLTTFLVGGGAMVYQKHMAGIVENTGPIANSHDAPLHGYQGGLPTPPVGPPGVPNGPPGLPPNLLEELFKNAQPKRPEMNAPSMTDVAQQPAPIQRALRATVCIISREGLGTGVILQMEGRKAFVITNRHVVDDEYADSRGRTQTSPSNIKDVIVKFVTGDEKKGKVVWAASDETDLALVEVDAPRSGVETARWEETPDVKIGDRVFAVGNPSGLGWTTTFGQVSAFRDHQYGSRRAPVVQTDARIGPGNSGGGLYTQEGVLIGINTFVVSSLRQNAGETGLGFAVRMSVIKDLKPTGLKFGGPAGSAESEGKVTPEGLKNKWK